MIKYSKLYDAAKKGCFDCILKLQNRDSVLKLRQLEFELTKLDKSKKYPKKYKVSWEHAVVECEDIEILNENLYTYTLPEKLWIIAQKTRQSN